MQYSTLFQPFPVLHTDRLILRQLTPADAADVFAMRSDPEVMRYIPRPIATITEDVLPLITMVEEAREKGTGIHWGITLKEANAIIGMIGYVNMLPEHFRAEVGYALVRSRHRQGIMREALARVVQYGFEEMALHTIEAIIDADNKASGALLETVGFRQEAYFREDFLFNGSFRNSIHYGLLHSDAYGHQ